MPKKTVLVIDDSLDMLELFKTILKINGYEALVAQNGKDAMSLLSSNSLPNLILLDLQLGDMTGIDFLSMLEAKWPNFTQSTPVVFITGMSKDEIPKTKAVGVIHKPVEITTLLDTIKKFIN